MSSNFQRNLECNDGNDVFKKHWPERRTDKKNAKENTNRVVVDVELSTDCLGHFHADFWVRYGSDKAIERGQGN